MAPEWFHPGNYLHLHEYVEDVRSIFVVTVIQKGPLLNFHLRGWQTPQDVYTESPGFAVLICKNFCYNSLVKTTNPLIAEAYIPVIKH